MVVDEGEEVDVVVVGVTIIISIITTSVSWKTMLTTRAKIMTITT
jgi:hypothetical protein